jgi:hypothetical protein
MFFGMRMWMIDPALLCRQHLLGEHNEVHKLAGCILKKRSLAGYITKGLVELHHLQIRHDRLVQEMLARKMNHQSPLPQIRFSRELGHVDRDESIEELKRRCPSCRENIKLKGKHLK